MAEHALTGHKVAIKILNRKKIKAMDMDEKGAGAARIEAQSSCLVLMSKRSPARDKNLAPLHAPPHHPLVRGGGDAH